MTGIKVWVVRLKTGYFEFVQSAKKPTALINDNYQYGFGVTSDKCAQIPPLKVGKPEQFILPQARRVKVK